MNITDRILRNILGKKSKKSLIFSDLLSKNAIRSLGRVVVGPSGADLRAQSLSQMRSSPSNKVSSPQPTKVVTIERPSSSSYRVSSKPTIEDSYFKTTASLPQKRYSSSSGSNNQPSSNLQNVWPSGTTKEQVERQYSSRGMIAPKDLTKGLVSMSNTSNVWPSGTTREQVERQYSSRGMAVPEQLVEGLPSKVVNNITGTSQRDEVIQKIARMWPPRRASYQLMRDVETGKDVRSTSPIFVGQYSGEWKEVVGTKKI